MKWSARLPAAAALTVAFASATVANDWNDRTNLSFDAPVIVPGATLPAGTYVFKLMDSPGTRHLVQIFNEDESRLMVTAQAIPTTRPEAQGDVVVRMNPTEAGAPAAMKAWFYPGSLYGHEFVYSEDQARDIARRTKTLVLSTDAPGTDLQKGRLHLYDAEGRRRDWQEDAVTMREWTAWREKQRARAKVAAPGSGENRESTAPVVRSEPAGMEIRVDDLEDHGSRYIGQTVSVTGEVEEVFGPRLFKIDEPGWADLDGEVLVHVPGNFAALVSEDDAVTVTGTVRMLKHPEIDDDLEWLELDEEAAAELIRRPVLVATHIVGGNDNVALAIEVAPARSPAQRDPSGAEGATGRTGRDEARSTGTTGTTGTTGAAREERSDRADRAAAGTRGGRGPLTDRSTLAGADREIVGRQVDVKGVKVVRLDADHGFWIETGGPSIFVLPADRQPAAAKEGDTVSVEGIVLEMPRRLREKAAGDDGNANDTVYIYAMTVE